MYKKNWQTISLWSHTLVLAHTLKSLRCLSFVHKQEAFKHYDDRLPRNNFFTEFSMRKNPIFYSSSILSDHRLSFSFHLIMFLFLLLTPPSASSMSFSISLLFSLSDLCFHHLFYPLIVAHPYHVSKSVKLSFFFLTHHGFLLHLLVNVFIS